MIKIRREHWQAAAILAILLTVIVLQWCVNRDLQSTVADLQIRREETPQQQGGVGGVETDIPEIAAAIGWVFPIAESDYKIESGYGIRVSPILHVERQHSGVDISSVVYSQVASAGPGVIEKHWPLPGTPVPGKPGVTYQGDAVLGGKVIILHDNGWRTVYGHMSWTRVHEGRRVKAGEIIGRTGATGLATGDHLHFEMITPDGRTVNPLLYVFAEPKESTWP